MGKYKIKYNYQTGDSFHTETCEEVLEFEWEDLDIAKEGLKRINEHYKWYESKNSYSFNKDEVSKPEWHNVNTDHVSNEYYLMNIRMDNGNEVQFWPPWVGYFESLHWAEIIIEDDPDMRIEVGY